MTLETIGNRFQIDGRVAPDNGAWRERPLPQRCRVELRGATGASRDISASVVYFED